MVKSGARHWPLAIIAFVVAGFAPSRQAISVKVVYPPSGAAIASSDSNFIFGSVSPPRAKLVIDGTVVKVHPNGAFIAWLPLPQRSVSAYNIVATLPASAGAAADTLRLAHPVRVPAPRSVLSSTGPLVVDSASVTPRPQQILRGGELVRVGIRAPSNAVAFVTLNGVRKYLVNGASLPEMIFGASPFDTNAARNYAGDPLQWSTLVPARQLTRSARLTIARGRDSVSFALPVVASADSLAPLFGMLGGAVAAPVSDTDRFVVARPSPGGTYKWILMPGTIVEVTGRDGDFVRVRFDESLEAWILAADVPLMPPGFAPPPAMPLNSRIVAAPGWVDLVIPIGQRVPYYVETFDNRIELTLYGVRENLDNVSHPTGDTLVRMLTTVQETGDRARITLHTSRRPFGYLMLWQGNNLVLRVRRTPRITVAAPLTGLTIAVDAGHPPAGATGPTGLYEGVATLQIAKRLKTLLEARGAKVLMTRTTDEPLDLAMRPVIARRANVHAMVSIHLNALPDGVNPFNAHGTSTYYFQQISAPLAREVQSQLLRRLKLRDLGVTYNTFAVTRPTWMPSVLCEGAFIMIPEQEAQLKTPEFQLAYATAVADGLQRYFASVAAGR